MSISVHHGVYQEREFLVQIARWKETNKNSNFVIIDGKTFREAERHLEGFTGMEKLVN